MKHGDTLNRDMRSAVTVGHIGVYVCVQVAVRWARHNAGIVRQRLEISNS